MNDITTGIRESVMIGDQVTIRLLSVHGDQVRIGIIAPVKLSVHRREVYDSIRAGDRPTHRTISTGK